jgi:hypothetical protein
MWVQGRVPSITVARAPRGPATYYERNQTVTDHIGPGTPLANLYGEMKQELANGHEPIKYHPVTSEEVAQLNAKLDIIGGQLNFIVNTVQGFMKAVESSPMAGMLAKRMGQ